ncbi:MAG: UpxY family transcription antiterminator [Chlamydiae bacterium]|nr:UpxY family transcription antiterminator [Chlamydiota bacterium]MBI3277980.1 UpxY family transcription antiterminator [Chlamydiota bacterium]
MDSLIQERFQELPNGSVLEVPSSRVLSSREEIFDYNFSDLDLDPMWFTPFWYALYTRSRHEKFLSQELQKKGIECFLPLRKIKKQWSDRRIIIEEPLFRSYIFVHFPFINRDKILNTKGAVRFVGDRDEIAVQVPEAEILAIQKFVEEEIRIDPFPYLKVGEPVRVKSGPFKGVEGFVVRKDKNCRLVVSFDLIMKSISIEIDEANIEMI